MAKIYWFTIFSVIGQTIYFLEFCGSPLPDAVHYYLNDLLIVPITAMLSLWSMQLIFKRSTLALHKWQVAYIVIFYSILFEAVLPIFIPRYTADWLDIIMYALGGISYWKFINRSKFI